MKTMNEDNREWEAFVAMYRIRDDFESALKKAMDVFWDAPQDDRWDRAYKATESIYEDMLMWETLQHVIDALEELNDDE